MYLLQHLEQYLKCSKYSEHVYLIKLKGNCYTYLYQDKESVECYLFHEVFFILTRSLRKYLLIIKLQALRQETHFGVGWGKAEKNPSQKLWKESAFNLSKIKLVPDETTQIGVSKEDKGINPSRDQWKKSLQLNFFK